jgi:ferredoxin
MRSSAAAAAGPSIAALSGCGSSPETETIAHRYIDQDACIGCGECVSLCPMGAISLDETSSIDPDECAECGVCSRSRVCPADAIRQGDLKWPRVLREVFSNPLAEHETTGVQGRGTPGIKANDSENRYQHGQIGVFVELGRPVLGARFADVEKVVKRFTAHGYAPVLENPVYELIEDHASGALKKEILNEKVISCVLEFVIPENESANLINIIDDLSRRVDTVFNVCVALRAEENGQSPFYRIFPQDVFCLPQAKVNIGIADGIRPVAEG